MHQRTATKVAVTSARMSCDLYPAAKNADGGGGAAGEYSWLLTTEEGTQYKGYVTGAKRSIYRRSCRKVIHADTHLGRPARALPGDCRPETVTNRRRC